MEINIDEIYHVASCCCPQYMYAHEVSMKLTMWRVVVVLNMHTKFWE